LGCDYLMVNSRSKGEIKALTSDLKKVLKELYGDRLMEIILYGSFARDEANEDSDIDIAIVLKGSVDKFQELDRLHEETYHLALKYGELISFYPISQEDLKDTEWPLHYYIQKEGVKV